EVAVWEVLATGFATTFLEAFLDHKPAGEALLLARRALLAKENPLGLVYTLYGSSELKIPRRSPSRALLIGLKASVRIASITRTLNQAPSRVSDTLATIQLPTSFLPDEPACKWHSKWSKSCHLRRQADQ